MRSFHSPLSLSLLLEKIPFFLLAAGASAITMVVQKAGGAVNINFSLEARLENAVVSYARYLGKLFYPAHLAAFYPLPAHWPMLAVIAAAILLTGISVAVVVLRRSGPYLLVGWLWFIGTLLPVIGVIQVGSQAMADRYTYVSAIGLVIALAIGIAELAQRWRAQKLAALVAAVTVIACAAQTRRQITYWQNNETLFQHAIQVTGDTDIACEELGDYYLSLKNFDAALDAYTRSLAVNPHSDKTENSIGLIFDRRGQYDEALRHIELAVKINPNNPVAHKNRALVLSRKGRREEAVGEFEESLRLNPNDAKTWFEYGNLLGRLGRFDEAISRFQQGLKLQPNDAVAHNDLGASFDKKGQTDAALAEFALAVQLNPNQQKARSNLGQILARKGRRDEAREQLKAALALDPKDTMAAKQLQALDQTVPAK